MPTTQRTQSFGQSHDLTFVDRLGTWLSSRSVRKAVPSFRGIDLGDFGCGFKATAVRPFLGEVGSAVLADVAIDPTLGQLPNVRLILGELPATLSEVPDRSLHVVLCLSVLEHLVEPDVALSHFHRVLRPGGLCVVNVPTWLGKRFLEFSAFRLGLSPAAEMDDHKRYYDPKDLWPLLVAAGFPPHGIRLRRHKGGLNAVAVCRIDEAQATDAGVAP